MGTRVVDTYCHQCHMKCHVRAHVRDGRIREFRHASCVKGRYAHEDVHHPHRLSYPMVRAGPRGNGSWRITSWEEALSLMAERGQVTLVKEIPAPVSILAGLKTPSVRELQDLGVARVSYGAAFTRAAITAVKRLAVEIRDSGSIAALKGAISSQEMKTLVSRGGAVS